MMARVQMTLPKSCPFWNLGQLSLFCTWIYYYVLGLIPDFEDYLKMLLGDLYATYI